MNKPTDNAVNGELEEIIRELLKQSGTPITHGVKRDMSLHDHLGLDSLSRAELFQRAEKKFGRKIPDKLLASIDTIGQLEEALQEAQAPAKHQQTMIRNLIVDEPVLVDPAKFKTLTDILLTYGEMTPNKPHVYFQQDDGKEEVITYGELLTRAKQVAAGLRERGLQEAETVAIMLPTTPDFFTAFFGILLAGGIPVPIYPPFRMHMLEAYAKTEAHILRNAEVRVLITFDRAEKLSLMLQAFVPSLKHVVTVPELEKHDIIVNLSHSKPDHIGFIQFTSGSTSDPKGVVLSHTNLLTNIRAYGKAIAASSRDVTVSWLPLYHDMGLIGKWLGSLYFGAPLILMTPFAFLNRPERWLWTIHYHRGTVSGGPNFAYELCVNKLDPAVLEGLDLSSWRVAANGAEKVYPRTLQAFCDKFAPFGFKRNAMMPMYGLAESSVGLCLPPLGREFRLDTVDRKLFEEKRSAEPTDNKEGLTFVGCGMPLPEHEIRIVDDENVVLPERSVGRLQFRGPSAMRGYYRNERATQAAFHNGWIETGDLAYLADKELFITGRRKDLIIKAGRNLYPVEIEELVGNIPGVRQGCVIAFAVNDAERGTDQLIVVAETRQAKQTDRDDIVYQIKEAINSALDVSVDRVVLVPPHSVPKTSSGKLQRAQGKQWYLEGRLGKGTLPAWLQIVKLATISAAKKLQHFAAFIGKSLYTAYIALLVSLSIPVFLVLIYFTKDETVQKAAHAWAKWFLRFVGCPLRIKGREYLTAQKPLVYVMNHASYFDAVVAMAILPAGTRLVAKKEIFSSPLLGMLLKKIRALPVDRLDFSKGIENADQIKTELKLGHSILIFPEGTFGYAAGLRPFRLGAFKIAAETNTPVCPIAIHGTRHILRNEEKLLKPHRVRATVSELILASGDEWEDITALRNQVRAKIALHCGEPTLDYIAAQTVAPKSGDIPRP